MGVEGPPESLRMTEIPIKFWSFSGTADGGFAEVDWVGSEAVFVTAVGVLHSSAIQKFH